MAFFQPSPPSFQLALLLVIVSRPTLVLMAPALAAGACAAMLYGLAFALRAVTPEGSADAESGRAFSVWTALGLAAMMAVMLVIAAALRDWLGETGVAGGAMVAGFVDTHAAAISIASLVASAKTNSRSAGRSADPGGDDEQCRGKNGDGDGCGLARFCAAHGAGPDRANCSGLGGRNPDTVSMTGPSPWGGARSSSMLMSKPRETSPQPGAPTMALGTFTGRLLVILVIAALAGAYGN